ncbi:hypothetical protein L7F22_035834 [Adiantum nelumboides]|nr:hypothetical protein [Adiantum nelumboides]
MQRPPPWAGPSLHLALVLEPAMACWPRPRALLSPLSSSHRQPHPHPLPCPLWLITMKHGQSSLKACPPPPPPPFSSLHSWMKNQATKEPSNSDKGTPRKGKSSTQELPIKIGRWTVPRVALSTQTKFCFTKEDFHTEYGLCLIGHDSKLLCDDDFSDEEWLRAWYLSMGKLSWIGDVQEPDDTVEDIAAKQDADVTTDKVEEDQEPAVCPKIEEFFQTALDGDILF